MACPALCLGMVKLRIPQVRGAGGHTSRLHLQRAFVYQVYDFLECHLFAGPRVLPARLRRSNGPSIALVGMFLRFGSCSTVPVEDLGEEWHIGAFVASLAAALRRDEGQRRWRRALWRNWSSMNMCKIKLRFKRPLPMLKKNNDSPVSDGTSRVSEQGWRLRVQALEGRPHSAKLGRYARN
jgi:hypothetical protein